jgi:hypothetical protein
MAWQASERSGHVLRRPRLLIFHYQSRIPSLDAIAWIESQSQNKDPSK